MYTISIDHFSATIEFFMTKSYRFTLIFAKFSKSEKMKIEFLLEHIICDVFKEEFNLNSSQLHHMK